MALATSSFPVPLSADQTVHFGRLTSATVSNTFFIEVLLPMMLEKSKRSSSCSLSCRFPAQAGGAAGHGEHDLQLIDVQRFGYES
jgi:hypothetical protein